MGGHVRVDGQVVTKAGTRVADDAAVEVASRRLRLPRRGQARDGAGRVRRSTSAARTRRGRRRLDRRLHPLPAAARRGRGDRPRRGLRAAARAGAHRSARDGAGATNARDLDPAALPYRPDLVVADVSFISLTLVLAGRSRAARGAVAGAGAGQAAVRGGPRPRPEGRRGAGSRRARGRCRAGRPLRLLTWRGATRRRRLRPSGPAGNHEYLLAIVSPDHVDALQRPAPDPAALARDAAGA